MLRKRLEEIEHESAQIETAVRAGQEQVQQWIARHANLQGARIELQRLIAEFEGKDLEKPKLEVVGKDKATEE